MEKLATVMKSLRLLVCGTLLLVAMGCLSGCAWMAYQAPVKPPLGGIFTEIKAPLTPNFNANPTGEATAKASKSYTRYLYIPLYGPQFFSFGWDRAAIAEIAQQGGLQEVSYADYELFSVLGIYSEFTVNVYGN
jgi:hypothetical protein